MADVSISSKASLVLDLPPSCIQFCPAHPEYFVIGTYNLQKENNGGQPVAEADSEVGEQPAVELEKAQTRNGTLVVYKIDGSRL
jgi:diphthamide biosynthesis protein 7